MLLRIAVITLGLCLTPGLSLVSDKVFDNCIFLGNSRLELQWTVNRTTSSIDFQMCGCDSGVERNAPNEYMGFGLSGSTSQTQMEGADATIAWVDNDDGPMAKDYHLSAYLPCVDGRGACPDILDSSGTCTDDILAVSGFRREGLQCVTFTRSFSTSDSTCDTPFDVDNDQFIVWAVGGIDETAFRHTTNAPMNEPPINFGRTPLKQCQGGLICPNCAAFTETIIDATGRDETFVAHIGPPANPRGYMSIANQAGWGIAWFINNTLIPHIQVERGYTYTFLTYSGTEGDGNNYHPFYLTSSKVGGRFFVSESLRRRERVFAGFDDAGEPLGVGPFCEFVEPAPASTILNTCGPEADYMAALTPPSCPEDQEPGGFTWTPDELTPNTIYYQCATHRNLGYKITVLPLIEPTTEPPTEPPTDGAPQLVATTAALVLMVLLTLATF